GLEASRDEFHIATAAIASASTAIAGSKYERKPAGAGGFVAGGPDTGGGAPVTGSGVATGGNGIGGVTWNGLSDGVRSSVGARRPPAGESKPASCWRNTDKSSSISLMC